MTKKKIAVKKRATKKRAIRTKSSKTKPENLSDRTRQLLDAEILHRFNQIERSNI
jgi:hypothetical protein